MIPSKRQPGDKILASDQNAMVDAARQAGLQTGEGLSFRSGPGGTGLFAETFGAKSFWGRITALGPDDDVDYTDERYWVKQIYVTNAAGDSLDALTYDVVDLIDIDGNVYTPSSGKAIVHGYHVTATNLAEIDNGTHSLSVEDTEATPPTIGTIVRVYMIYDSRDSTNIHYVFSTGIAKGLSANPDEIGPDPEASPSRDTETWEAASPSASGSTAMEGAILKVLTRVVYDDAGDEILYGFYRELLFDSVGLLVSIGEETRYTIDTPGACP